MLDIADLSEFTPQEFARIPRMKSGSWERLPGFQKMTPNSLYRTEARCPSQKATQMQRTVGILQILSTAARFKDIKLGRKSDGCMTIYGLCFFGAEQ